MKEKRTYKRFELIPFLAILGCAGMLLFECIFIFELYDRAVEQPETPILSVPVIETPAASVEPARREPVKPIEAPVVPAAPAEVPPAEIETAPAPAPVG